MGYTCLLYTSAIRVTVCSTSKPPMAPLAFADLDFYGQVKAAAVEGGAKVHLASGAIGGFDVLQTVTLMAEAQKLSLIHI